MITNILKTAGILLILGTSVLASEKITREKEDLSKLPSDYDMILAYYGRPGTSRMGILGQYPLDTLFRKIKAHAKEYEKILNYRYRITPGVDVVYDLAIREPGTGGNYLIPLSEKTLLKYIHKAKEYGAVVILDMQLGKKSPPQAIKPVLRYLKYENVHIAIDPEFSVDNLNVRPGKVIGSVTAEEINQVQALMSSYLKEHSIREEKILIVHMFTEKMLAHKNALRYYEKIHLVMNLDGHGSPALKVKIYNGIYTKSRAVKFAGGFKLFFKEDNPLMSPRQVLGLEPVGRYKIKNMPTYINYQ
ncbi:hypothetical protein ACM66Z_06085 [Sulfurovum sp. ST-21]|nr:hypothetical protein [Sulfurovum indicum]